ncbi:serine/threonine-protein phosphatase 2A regulatory subunit B'' subunit gamma isoform X2 [Drosophila busckii]|uniref:serine/threonine-protein phosphatase 2A regulatory subunit B'' subunit gamma isoform X2 n=1 Tax=Drosophila busckii TaxID=30019 RepID=UPI00083EE1F5|nr:serine/threonine-protein phosphatase 2A regulatory subunit B'' subunit gamma isoform X2 [Drosophila busckii]
MELDPELVEAFANLKVSTRDISAEELANFDEHAPLRARAEPKHPSFAHIPKFFTPPPPPDDKLRHLLRREAHALFLQQKSDELLNNEELVELWQQLELHVSGTTAKQQQLIDFENYCKLQSVISAKSRKYLTAELFAQLLSNSPYLGCIEILSIYNYTMRKGWITQCRIGLSFYDDVGQGYLREFDMENYIADLIPTLKQLENKLQPAFEKFYVCTVVKKFFFFLDYKHTGRIRILDMLASGYIDELLELRELPQSTDEQLQLSNWFSLPSVLQVYGSFLTLDLDQNGLLSKEELAGFGSGTLTSSFLERVFEECMTYDGQMDYKSYVDFVLALSNRKAIHYLFRILDVEHLGYLTTQTVRYFFKDIQAQLAEPINFDDINNEIFDMVKPKDSCKITQQDLHNCGQAETVVSILIEFHKFWAYENRDEYPQNA